MKVDEDLDRPFLIEPKMASTLVRQTYSLLSNLSCLCHQVYWTQARSLHAFPWYSQHCTESQTWCFGYWNDFTWLDILKAIINVNLMKLKTDGAYVQQLLLGWLWDSQFPQPTCSWKWVGTPNPLRAPNLTLKPFFRRRCILTTGLGVSLESYTHE